MKMRRSLVRAAHVILLTGAVACACVLTGCSSLKHISAAEFKHAIHPNYMQMETLPMYSSEYIGQANGRAFILRKRRPLIGKKWKEEVHFTESDQLGEEFLRRLEERISNQAVEATS